MKFITIIIPTYNRIFLLSRCLQSLLNQNLQNVSASSEIIIALDQRDTETAAWFERQHLKQTIPIKCVRASQHGVNAARNTGIQTAKGDILYFLDDDCVVPVDNWIEKIECVFNKYADAAAVGGKYLTDPTSHFYILARNELYNYFMNIHKIQNNQIRALLGGNTGYRRFVFEKYGKFDENIVYGSAETELNQRLIKNSELLYYSRDLSLLHIRARNKMSVYIMQSFHQGIGQIYSQTKNGRLKNPCSRKVWFFQIVREIQGSFLLKFKVSLFLLCIGIAYHAGLISGLLKYKKKYHQLHEEIS